MKTVYWRVTDPEHKFISQFSWAASMYYPMLNKFFETFFRGDFPSQGKQVYLDHFAEVCSLVPPERLLIYNISDGWGRLCKFLGEEIPETPFPTGNDVANFIKRSRTRNRHQMMNGALYAVAMGIVLLAVVAFMFYILTRLRY
jgi:hypothetical protein